MANAIQAGKWLAEGKTVIDPLGFRMTGSLGTVHLINEDGQVDEEAAEMYISDLLSNEWELAE